MARRRNLERRDSQVLFSRLRSHCSAFYQGNVEGWKRGTEQPQRCAPQSLWRDDFPNWSVADDKVGVHTDQKEKISGIFILLPLLPPANYPMMDFWKQVGPSKPVSGW